MTKKTHPTTHAYHRCTFRVPSNSSTPSESNIFQPNVRLHKTLLIIFNYLFILDVIYGNYMWAFKKFRTSALSEWLIILLYVVFRINISLKIIKPQYDAVIINHDSENGLFAGRRWTMVISIRGLFLRSVVYELTGFKSRCFVTGSRNPWMRKKIICYSNGNINEAYSSSADFFRLHVAILFESTYRVNTEILTKFYRFLSYVNNGTWKILINATVPHDPYNKKDTSVGKKVFSVSKLVIKPGSLSNGQLPAFSLQQRRVTSVYYDWYLSLLLFGK